MISETQQNLVNTEFTHPFYIISHDTSEYWHISGLFLKIFAERTRLYRDLDAENAESSFQQLLNLHNVLSGDEDAFEEQADQEFSSSLHQEFPYLAYQKNQKWQKYLTWEHSLTPPVVVSFHPNRSILEVYDDITL